MARYSDTSLAEMCTAIHQTLGEVLVTSSDLTVSQNYNRLSEGINDPGVLQVYPESGSPVSTGGRTHKLTMGDTDGPVIEEEITIHVDYYAKQRGADLAEDMAAMVAGVDAIRANLKTQDCQPFDLTNCRSFQWSWTRSTFAYGAPELLYVGARFILVLRLF